MDMVTPMVEEDMATLMVEEEDMATLMVVEAMVIPTLVTVKALIL